MSNGFTQLNTAVGAYQARKTREAVEEQTRLLRGERDDQIRAELNREWHAILQERDRVWQDACDRVWRQGWESGYGQGYSDALRDERDQRPE